MRNPLFENANFCMPFYICIAAKKSKSSIVLLLGVFISTIPMYLRNIVREKHFRPGTVAQVYNPSYL
jgi:hypothetical protein